MNLLREALGVAGRRNIALESEEDSIAAMTPEASDVVVMKGPLSDNYTEALNCLYAKDAATDPTAQPEPPAETGINVDPDAVVPAPGTAIEPEELTNIPEVTQVVLESQAQDAALVQSLHTALTPQDPPTEEYMTLYGVSETDIDQEDITEVTKLLAEASDPGNVTVMIDDQIPPAEDCTDADKAEAAKLSAGLEALTISMGGKVVKNWKGFTEHYKARRTK